VSVVAHGRVICVYPSDAEEAVMAQWEHGAMVDFCKESATDQYRWVRMRAGTTGDHTFTVRRYAQQRTHLHVPVPDLLGTAVLRSANEKDRIVRCESKIDGDEVLFRIPDCIEFEREQ
jgi:hypothetical protein